MVSPGGLEAGAAAPSNHVSPRARGTAARCQICDVDLSGERIFFRRYRACPDHVHADQIELEGAPHRFCQQCGRFHRLDCFDGDKRSCREQLAQHAARRRYLYRLRHGGGDRGGDRGGGSGSGGRPKSSTTGASTAATSSGSEQEGGEAALGSADGPLGGGLSGSAAKRLRLMMQEHLDSQGAPQAQQPHLLAPQHPQAAASPLLQHLTQQAHGCGTLPPVEQLRQWQHRSDSGLSAQQAAQVQQALNWHRTDSARSTQHAQQVLSWQRADSVKSAVQAAAAQQAAAHALSWQRTDSGKSSTAQLGLLEAAAAAVAAAAASELATPQSAATEPLGPARQQQCQSAKQATPPASPQPQATAAELNRWVEEQLRQRHGGASPQLQVPDMGGGAAAAAAAAADGRQRRSAFGPAGQPGDAAALWGELWQAAQPRGAAATPPLPLARTAATPPPTSPSPRQGRQIWRPVPQRVGVLAPSLSAAVSTGLLPLAVAAAQAQPLSSLLHQMQQQAGPLQPHELVRALERMQPPPTLVAMPAAAAAPTPPDHLVALLAKVAPLLHG